MPAEKPLVIIAESYSGAVVPLLRELQPRIKAIIFVATFLTSPHPILSQLSKVAPMGLALKLAYVDWFVKLFCLGNDAGSSIIELFRQALKSADNDAMIQRIHSLAALDMRNKAGWIQGIPCLYIQASQDKLVPSRGFTDFKQLIPEIKIAQINGPHFLLQARPDECVKVLSEFLKDQHIKC